jgi:threonyl-tRNA synthetase
MHPSRAAQLLHSALRLTPRAARPTRTTFHHGYCSSCEAKESPTDKKIKAKAVIDPPIPPADHRQLGIEQGLFATSIYSPGSPLFLPNGARIFNRLVAFLRAQYTYYGFHEVITPTIYKKSLWERSGHWDNYAEDMFSATGRGASGTKDGRQIGEDEEYGLKPMNCPGHCLLYASRPRSFRELPIRYADFSPLHRNEISGALSGLTRVRRFHQDDGHIFCQPSQVAEEISRTLDFVRLTYETFKLGPYRLVLSTRPRENYIGTEKEWNNAEVALQQALDASGQTWSLNEGDGAFYGPKIDIILKDSDGKEHQTATIQLDFQLPKRFELEYQGQAPELEQDGVTITDPELLADNGPLRPVMIHRAVLGSVERFMALLIEHYNGHWPFWLNPRQIIILTVNQDKAVVDYALKAKDEIQGGGMNLQLRRSSDQSNALNGDIKETDRAVRARELDRTTFSVDLDDSARSLGKKLSDAKRKRYSVIIVIGKQDADRGQSVAVDFTGITDPQGDIRRLVQEEDKPLQKVDVEIRQLRGTLLAIERAYL